MPPIAAPASSRLSTRPLNDSELEYLRSIVRASGTTEETSNDDNRTARGIIYGVLLSSVIWSGVFFWALFFH
jgi:hypothetical protein